MLTWLSNGFCLLLGFASVFAIAQRKPDHKFLSEVNLFAAAAMIGTAVLAGSGPISWSAPSFFCLGFFPITFRLDLLSGIFLGLLGAISVAATLFSPGYLSHLGDRIHSGQYWTAFSLFLLSMALVILSADAISFIVFWEIMSLSSLALVAVEHKQHKVQKAALIYLGATRIATAFIAAGFLWMHSIAHSWNFVDWHFDSARQYLPAFLIFLGFSIKAGIWPFHIWLPYAHPAAPAPVSSLMSGVMIKIAIYGIIRILVLGDLNCPAIAYGALFLGTVSAFWGVLFALMQDDLKRLLAYSSVENVGLLLVAIAVCLLSRSSGLSEIAAIALAGAIFHSVNHGLFKSLLFLSAGSVDACAHTLDLGRLGGLAKSMPWTMACFLVGSAAICALPPLNGFAGKWLFYQSMFQSVWQSSVLIDRALFLAVMCVLSVVGGLAIACFTKAMGVSFLGIARSKSAAQAKDSDLGMIVAQVLLAAACIALGVMVPHALAILQPVCDQAVHHTTSVGRAFTIPQGALALAFMTLILLIHFLYLNGSRVRKYITWECGFGTLSSRTQVTPDSFAQPVARIFSPLLQYHFESEITGSDRRHFPEQITVEPRMASILEQRVYTPAVAIVGYLARLLAKLQAGSIHLYLIYLCLTLIILLFLGIGM